MRVMLGLYTDYIRLWVWGLSDTVDGRNPASVFFRQPSLPTLNFVLGLGFRV